MSQFTHTPITVRHLKDAVLQIGAQADDPVYVLLRQDGAATSVHGVTQHEGRVLFTLQSHKDNKNRLSIAQAIYAINKMDKADDLPLAVILVAGETVAGWNIVDVFLMREQRGIVLSPFRRDEVEKLREVKDGQHRQRPNR
jgi:hypothetical protein